MTDWIFPHLDEAAVTVASFAWIGCVVIVALAAFYVIADEHLGEVWQWARSWFADPAETIARQDITEADRQVAKIIATNHPQWARHFPEERETDRIWNPPVVVPIRQGRVH